MANNRELSQFANVVGYNGGNIGINTDNPSNLLHIDGGTDQLKLSDGSGSFEFRAGNVLMIKDNGTERLRIRTSGQVQFSNGSFSDNVDCIMANGGTMEIGAQSIIKFRTATNERLRIASDGQATFDKGAPGSANQVIARFQAESSRRLDIVWHDSGSLLGFDLPGSHSYTFKTGGTERLRLTSDGRLHVGDSLGNNHSGMFQVIHEGGGNQTNDCLAFFETNANDWCIITNSNEGGSANHYHMYFMEEGTVRGSIAGSHGQNVTYGQGSDYRWKENIIDLTETEGIDICKRLRPRKYNWIENREGTGQINTVDGFIAHEVQEAGVLGAVTGEKDAVNEDGSIDGQMLDYGQMTPVLAAAIKGLIAKVETLETQNTDLLARVTALEGS